MHSDTYTLIAGSLLSVLVGQVTAGGVNPDLFSLLSNLSASGVLAVTFWWLMKRVETRLDEALNDYKRLTETLIEMLQDKDKEDKQ